MPGSRLRRPNLNKRPSKPTLSCSRHGSAFSRRDASEVLSPSPSKKRAQETPGARCTRSLACKVKQAHECIHHRFTEQSGVSCAMVLRLIPCSPRRTGLSCHRRPRKNSRELDTSVGVPGPHGFAVRQLRPRQKRRLRPSHPTPRFVTTAICPSFGVGRGRYRGDLCSGKQKYFFKRGLTRVSKNSLDGQITCTMS